MSVAQIAPPDDEERADFRRAAAPAAQVFERNVAPAKRGLWQAARMAIGTPSPAEKNFGDRPASLGPVGLRHVALLLAAWTAITLAFAAQGWWAALRRGTPQHWWPSLGYSAAIFSIWVLLTLPVLWFAARVERSGRSRLRKTALYCLGFPVVATLHVGLFALAYWPLYNDDGRIPSPLAMAERMLVPNAHTNLVFYAALVMIAAGGTILKRQPVGDDGPATQTQPAIVAPELLRIRSRGVIRDLAFDEIGWIGTAGDYVEVHSSGGNHLIEESLTALAARLPDDQFARIHRQTIVRLELIREIRSQGRGDGLVRLADGTELRLSRRYREAVANWIKRT